jgi:hypothetical protein
MIALERAPSLTARIAFLGHVLGHRRLSHRKAKLEQLAMDARPSNKIERNVCLIAHFFNSIDPLLTSANSKAPFSAGQLDQYDASSLTLGVA